MERDHGPQPNRHSRTYLIAIVIIAVVVAMVVLHLTGIVGTGSH